MREGEAAEAEEGGLIFWGRGVGMLHGSREIFERYVIHSGVSCGLTDDDWGRGRDGESSEFEGEEAFAQGVI